MMELGDGVTAAAAFVGGYLGQRHATGKLAEDVAALRARLESAERRARRQGLVVAGALRRLRQVEGSRGA
jgi:hypothetical protein